MVAPTEVQKWLGITLEGWLTIVAVILGPILALAAQRWLDNLRERHQRQVRVFRELMITRTARLSPRHVEALNAVPLEFENKRKERAVLTAWRAYLGHLNTDSSKNYPVWVSEGSTMLIGLLHAMSQQLGYTFEESSIQNEIYLPQYFNTLEQEQTALRQRLLELTDGTGRRKLPIAIFEQGFPDVHLPDSTK